MQGLLPVLMFPVRSRPLAVAALLAAAGCSRDDAPQLATPGGSALLAALPPPVPSARRTPGAAQIATSARIRLATWNLKWLSAEDDVGPVKRKAADFQRLKGYADRLDADIIALQEVDGSQAAKRVFDPARYAVHLTSRSDAQRTGFAYDRQLRVQSNPDYTELDVGGVRYGADITVRLGAHRLRLLSVHLKSGCLERPLHSSDRPCQKLSQQLPRLEAWIDARAAEQVPFAVLGDFNRRLFKQPHDRFWVELDDGQPPEADLWSPTEGQTARCWNRKHPDFIDQLVLSRSARALMVGGSFTEHVYDPADARHRRVLSDHCPLAVVLRSTAGAETAPPSPMRK